MARFLFRLPDVGEGVTEAEIMDWHVKHNRALHERLLALRVVTESIPWVNGSERQSVIEVAPNFWRATARYGFMERPDIPVLLRQAQAQGCVSGGWA